MNQKLKNADQNLGKTFCVESGIMGVVDSNPNNLIKIIESKSGKVYPLNKPPKTGAYKHMLNIVLTLSDQSSKKDSATTNAYITSCDDENPFENWKLLPRMNDKKGWKNISQSSLKTF